MTGRIVILYRRAKTEPWRVATGPLWQPDDVDHAGWLIRAAKRWPHPKERQTEYCIGFMRTGQPRTSR